MNWLAKAVLATLFLGFFGLFDKLSTFQDPVISNFIISFTGTVVFLILIFVSRKRLIFSKEAFLSGIFAGVAGLTLLYSLVSNFVLVVFPFVSFASVVFFFIILFFEKPKLSNYQKMLVATGIIISVLGLLIASTATSGGISSFLNNLALNPRFFILGSLISVGYGLWSFFSYLAIKKKNAENLNVNFWIVTGSLAIAVIAFVIIGVSSPINFNDLRNVFPVFAALSIVGGVIFGLSAYKAASGKSKIQETIVAILTNAEIIPLIFLSYFILNEFTFEGIVGSFIVFIGLSILNYAESLR